MRGASFRRRRGQTSPVPGESAKETVKTIACGNAGCSGVSAVDTRVLSTFCTRGHGCSGHPVFPTPSDFWAGSLQNLGRVAPREGGRVSGIGCLKIESGIAGAGMFRVPDAVQRPPGDAKHRPVRCTAEPGPINALRDVWAPDQQRTTPQKSGALRSIRGTQGQHTVRRPRAGGDPVFRSVSDGIEEARHTGYSAFAEYDDS